MKIEIGTLPDELRSLVGGEYLRPATEDDRIDGIQPRWVVAPGSAEEVAAVLRTANDAGCAVAPRGGGSKLGWGNPLRTVELVLSTRRLDRVVEHAWGDMTATVQAGCTVSAFQHTLAEHGQRLALDTLWPERATVGGLLATNDSGALRHRFGSLRDMVLGVTVALADGTLARSGGKVVKNVAGYDLPKLMNGSLGTLGVIVEATFRLYPLPPETRTLSVGMPSVAAASDLLLHVLDATLSPVSLQLRAGSEQSPVVDVRFEGIPAGIDSQTQQFERIGADMNDRGGGAMHHAQNGEAASIWDARQALWEGAEPALVCKFSVLPSHIGAFVEAVQRVAAPLKLRWDVVAQAIGVGALRLEGANDQVLLVALSMLRRELTGWDGSLVALGCPASIKSRIDVWGDGGDALPLMRRVKELFDPNAILNPGRYIGGL